MSIVWGLADEHSGQSGQTLGVIAKLGVPYTLKRLEYNFLGRLPNIWLGASLFGIDREHSSSITPPWPSLVIASGRRTLPVLRTIKHKSPQTVTVYLMRPDHMRGIDLVVMPEHDDPPKQPNVVATMAPLHAVTSETLAASRHAWEGQFAHLPRPWVALALGGDTKQGRYTAADWRELFRQAMELAGNGSLLITSSRRTPQEAIALAAALVHGPHLLHNFHTDKDNPYLGILGCADAIIVTGDSLAMTAEACVAGKPLFLYAVPKVTPQKYIRFHQALYARGVARPLDGEARLGWMPAETLDDAAHVAAEIRARFPHALA